MEYKGINLPEPFVKKARRGCIRTIGQYNGETHKFIPPVLDPTRNAVDAIWESYKEYNLFPDEDEFDGVLKQIRLSADTAPEVVSGSISDSSSEIFDIVRIIEEDHSESTLLYVGAKKFVVLESSKSSIIFNDVLICNTMPITEEEREEFTVKRGGKSFSPSEFGTNYKFPFQTKRIVRLETLRSPEIYKIIDECDRFGNCELLPMTQPAEEVFATLIKDISEARSKNDDTYLPVSGTYPDYEILLEKAKKSGVRTFVLNTLIELIEKGVEKHYAFVEDDWKKSQKWFDEQARKRKAKLENDYKIAESDLMGTLKKSLKQRRILLFFKAETKVPAKVDEFIHQSIAKLDDLADQGIGHEKGWAASQYELAKQKTKPKPGENVRTGLTLGIIVALSIYVGITWFGVKGSLDTFEAETKVVPEMVQNQQFNEAKELVATSAAAFKPSYLRFIISRKTHQREAYIESSIDAFVDERVDQITSFINANWGRIDSFTWDLIVEAMEYRPDDPRLNEFREQYINQ